jgi:hypothetical protein
MVEYQVLILEPSPSDAVDQLNIMAAEGWHVVGVAHEDRVIMERIPRKSWDQNEAYAMIGNRHIGI